MAVLVILDQEDWEKSEKLRHRFELALIASDADRFLPLFYPEIFRVRRDVTAEELSANGDIPALENTTIKWADRFDPTEAETILRNLTQGGEGTLIGGQVQWKE